MKKLSFQKIFCFISFLFILSCCVFYGTRFIKLYLENEKELEVEANTLAKVIRDNNIENENYKNINDHEYFINNSDNNYLKYSNILWRVVKVDQDNSITVISDNSLTSLAYGEYLDYLNSFPFKWLNNNNSEEYSGILEKNLNNKETYLQKTIACLDVIDTLNNENCKNTNKDNYVSLLSIPDYINIGNKDSYVINNENFYLNNSNTNNEIWYINDEGSITTSKGTDVIGIKPVITIKSNIDFISGDGTKENPYIIETEQGLFGSYVKLGDDIWQIYQVNETDVRLVLNDYIKINNTELKHIYSNINSYHNDTKAGSLAHYLNNTFFNTLSYKDKINETSWPNGYYGSATQYNYKEAIENTIETKVALISITDIRLNSTLENYFTLTSTKEKGSMVYTINSSQKIYGKNIQNKLNVVPAISINKDLLTKGNGTIESPYEME